MRRGASRREHPTDSERTTASDPAVARRSTRDSGRPWAVAVRHAPAIAVFLVLTTATVLVTVALRDLVHNQERRLLDERATEVAAFLRTSTSDTRSGLVAAGSVAATDGGSSPLFARLAAGLTGSGGTVVVAQQRAGRLLATAVEGPAVTRGEWVAGDVGSTARRALATVAATGLVADLVTDGGARRVVVAVPLQGDVPSVAYVLSAPLTGRPVKPTADSPYRELDVALYAGPRADPSRIVLASGSVPSNSNEYVSRSLAIGADSWLLLTAARQPLIGSVAADFPWFVLAGGLLLAVVLTTLIEVLTRRRAYALRLVDQRTRALVEAQALAEAASRSKSEFLSRVSHELRTPLNAVLGFGQLLELDDLTDLQRESVTQITRGGRHLLDLINEVLDISRIESGQLSLSPEPVLVSELLADVVDLVRPLAEERGIHLISGEGRACDQYVLADRQRVKQVLLNLLGNGIKYNRQGGSVSIECAAGASGRLRIQVTDTGPGIPREKLGRLFVPFERLGAEQTTVEGTGIGLALSRRLAEEMGGTLDVESTVGRGSTFWAEFPVVEGPSERYSHLDPPSRVRGGSQDGEGPGPAIVHIEDNLANIALIERVVAQRPGLTLISAMQGRLGVELARQHRPVLILLDLNLADLPGEEVLRQLREDPVTRGIPVVIISADAMPRQVQRLLSSGAQAYLTKPFDVRELLELVDRAVGERAPVAAAASPDGPAEQGL